MLSLIQEQPASRVNEAKLRLDEARALLYLVEMGRPAMWVLSLAAVLLLAVFLLAAGSPPLAGLLTGAAVSLSLCRYGPHWWPGKR